jgi:hypothetical protein
MAVKDDSCSQEKMRLTSQRCDNSGMVQLPQSGTGNDSLGIIKIHFFI